SGLDNYILIDKGAKDSIQRAYGVITRNGIVGVVENTSKNYCRIISILNTNRAINAQLKNSENFGTLSWKGEDTNKMYLSDMTLLATVTTGDRQTTNVPSLISPKAIDIGTAEIRTLDQAGYYYLINIKLSNGRSNIGNVYIIRNNSCEGIVSLTPIDIQ